MRDAARLVAMSFFVCWRMSAYIPADWMPQWSWVFEPAEADPFSAPLQGNEASLLEDAHEDDDAVWDDPGLVPGESGEDVGAPVRWQSESGHALLVDTEQQLQSMQRWDWEQELSSIKRTRVLVEVMPARTGKTHGKQQLNAPARARLLQSRRETAASPRPGMVILVSLAANDFGVAEWAGVRHLHENYNGEAMYDACIQKEVDQFLDNAAGGSAVLNANRLSLLPTILGHLDDFAAQSPCGPRSRGGFWARLFTVSPAEIQMGVAFVGFALAYTLVLRRRTEARDSGEVHGDAAAPAVSAESQPAYHGPTIGGVAATLWTALVGEDEGDDD